MTGREELKELGEEIKRMSDMGLCDDATMGLLARSVRAMFSHLISPELSREDAARRLGVSTRTLSRLVESGEIAPPRRKGFREKAYSKASIEEYIARKKDKP